MVDILPKYKTYNIKPTTPVIHYKCAYCGKEGVRRKSHVKNPNLIFCNNHCSLMYRNAKKYAENRIRKITDKEIKDLYNKYLPNIKCICNNFLSDKYKLKGRVDIDELYMVSMRACYLAIRNSKDRDNISLNYLYRTIKRTVHNHVYLDIYNLEDKQHEIDRDYINLGQVDEVDKTLMLKVEKDYIQEIEDTFDRDIKIKLVEGAIESKAQSKLMRMAFDRYIREMSVDKMMLKWGVANRHDLCNRVYLGKKILEKEIEEILDNISSSC